MMIKTFGDVQHRWSKWHGQCCPMCRQGSLTDGVRERSAPTPDGKTVTFKQIAAWCSHCEEGLVIHSPIREVDMAEFLRAKSLFEAEQLGRVPEPATVQAL